MALDISDPPQSWADANWTESTGSVTYFAQNGNTAENDRDYAWGAANTHARHRSYMYYPVTSTDAEQWFIYPRCDKCDGTQPHLRQLLRDGRTYLCGGMLIQ